MSQTKVVRFVSGGREIASRVEIATSFWGRFRGLMARDALPEGHGLWLPDTGIHMFFMRFPIDGVFLAPAAGRKQARLGPGTWRVVGIRPDLPPWRGLVLRVGGATSCVELPAGSAARAGLAVGEVLEALPAERAIG